MATGRQCRIKNGSYYEGDVSHFSFWNCDDPEEAVFIEMTIRGPNGGPLPNTSVRITSATDNLQIYAIPILLVMSRGLYPKAGHCCWKY
jgi:hypothetical protein